jgi:hydrogenase nickel incorporation protein HypA/HybF
VHLEIGAFSGVEVEALQFALEVLSPGTLLETARFTFHTPHLLLYCLDCENEYIGDPEDLLCPGCLGADFEVRQGREMVVRSIHGT